MGCSRCNGTNVMLNENDTCANFRECSKRQAEDALKKLRADIADREAEEAAAKKNLEDAGAAADAREAEEAAAKKAVEDAAAKVVADATGQDEQQQQQEPPCGAERLAETIADHDREEAIADGGKAPGKCKGAMKIGKFFTVLGAAGGITAGFCAYFEAPFMFVKDAGLSDGGITLIVLSAVFFTFGLALWIGGCYGNRFIRWCPMS